MICVFSFNIFAQKKNNPSKNISLIFIHYVGDSLLKLDSRLYKNDLNQEFTISKFKYYIGNIELIKNDGSVFLVNKYFLVNEENLNSKKISLEKIPNGEYVSVRFNIGIDSIDNTSGIQSGVLDPINGMFWTWNTGYIFLKLEGTAITSTAPNSILEYHIGGFKKPYNCIRSINIPLEKTIVIPNLNDEKIEIEVDVLEILKSPTTIDFSILPSVTDFNNCTTIADNYSNMFSILKNKNAK